jgi:formylmethanofuran dehydrogenase subunit E
MKSLEEYLTMAAEAHGHMCPGQVLGVRMAMLGLKSIGIEDPIESAKRLMTFVEIDRCMTDAVSLVTGCRLGKRSLKYLDYGKVAATFMDLESARAVRVVARDESRTIAQAMFPEIAKPYQRQLEAYKVMEDSELFNLEAVRVKISSDDLPGRPRSRTVCDQCGEGINDHREQVIGGRVLCRSCGSQGYYEKIGLKSG